MLEADRSLGYEFRGFVEDLVEAEPGQLPLALLGDPRRVIEVADLMGVRNIFVAAKLSHLSETSGVLFKIKDDPRITSVGKWLRRLSIDEIPQLINVIRGEMSLVGPRPALAAEAEQWDDSLHNRLRVQPGITGMWQVAGHDDLDHDATYAQLDLYYVDNWSLLTDVLILARTVPVVLGIGWSRRGS